MRVIFLVIVILILSTLEGKVNVCRSSGDLLSYLILIIISKILTKLIVPGYTGNALIMEKLSTPVKKQYDPWKIILGYEALTVTIKK